MKAVLMSIKPKWCEKIADGEKTIEVRKTRPKIETPFKCYIYCTKTGEGYFYKTWLDKNRLQHSEECLGKVIGEFVCDGIDNYTAEFVDDDCYEDIRRVWIDDEGDEWSGIVTTNEEANPNNCYLCKQSCLSYEDIKNYVGINFHNKPFYGWHISELTIYDKPKELEEFDYYCKKERQAASEICKGCKYCFKGTTSGDIYCDRTVLTAPQSWCYVEEI